MKHKKEWNTCDLCGCQVKLGPYSGEIYHLSANRVAYVDKIKIKRYYEQPMDCDEICTSCQDAILSTVYKLQKSEPKK